MWRDGSNFPPPPAADSCSLIANSPRSSPAVPETGGFVRTGTSIPYPCNSRTPVRARKIGYKGGRCHALGNGCRGAGYPLGRERPVALGWRLQFSRQDIV